MTDTTQLVSALEGYITALSRNNGAMEQSFGELERSWRALSMVYHGNGAEQFATMFGGSMRKMQECSAMMNLIQHKLKERLEYLRQLDTPGGA
ncbi:MULTISPECIES: WXG100 family type VII secretion target [Novacetimonas]|uniref:Uncharacterized protein n=2 Tax=Novacetimonas TaxID=2919364 RepID=A0A318Q694_9PROT|nr:MULTISPECIES: WXG100 family type VII secretion target [Novacetimonas]MBV1833919.1 hypothetical protein [Novacetimonas pomaceti]PYD47238.1 hypothetical protein C3920_10980 [Novacetimonas pomaceti]PYD75116.1 hypothetical protein CFR71_10910 [Novacetimonas pomaceti]RBM07729.1 hypothetical protein NJLHNGOC_06815 [Novacetimonas cocois]